jgi:hypothetical protein
MSFVAPYMQREWDNVFRNEAKKRNCLMCGIQFTSQDRGNRKCGVCNNKKGVRNERMKYNY